MTMTMPCEPYLKVIGKFHIGITVALCAATLICEAECHLQQKMSQMSLGV